MRLWESISEISLPRWSICPFGMLTVTSLSVCILYWVATLSMQSSTTSSHLINKQLTITGTSECITSKKLKSTQLPALMMVVRQCKTKWNGQSKFRVFGYFSQYYYKLLLPSSIAVMCEESGALNVMSQRNFCTVCSNIFHKQAVRGRPPRYAPAQACKWWYDIRHVRIWIGHHYCMSMSACQYDQPKRPGDLDLWPFWPWKWCPSHVWRGLPRCQC